MDVLYSLLDVNNQRLDMIVQEKIFTNTLNFVVTTITDEVLSIPNSTIDRFCIDILPKIGYNIKSLILESESMQRILLATDYPNLTELKLYNVNNEIVTQYFTVESPFRGLFQEQITDLILVYNDEIRMLPMNLDTKCIYEYSLKCFKNLKHLSINDLPSTTWLSLNLNKLRVDICDFEDCFGLLDGRLKQLTTFIVEIYRPGNDLSTNYNMNNLSNMKCFSLKCRCPTNEYHTRVLPLLRRIIALEELNLNIINQERTSLIDGTQINDKILVYMSNLRKFTFYINTDVNLHHLTHYPANIH